jgi:ketosteroid isomerase-like protein
LATDEKWLSGLVLFVTVLLCFGGCRAAREEAGVGRSAEMAKAITSLREAYAAFNRGDMDVAVKSLDPQIEWSEPAEFPGGGTYHGREQAKGYLTQSRAGAAEVNSDPERFIIVGDRIVVFVHARVRPKGSNEYQDIRLADVYTVRDGKIVEMRAFANRQDALQWVGAEEVTR